MYFEHTPHHAADTSKKKKRPVGLYIIGQVCLLVETIIRVLMIN